MDFVGTVERVVQAIEVVGVIIIVLGIFWAFIRYGRSYYRHGKPPSFKTLRRSLGRVTLIGLDLLVAADIVLTVATPSSLESLGALALLVAIRSFLSIEIDMEIEGRWPWQQADAQASAGRDAASGDR